MFCSASAKVKSDTLKPRSRVTGTTNSPRLCRIPMARLSITDAPSRIATCCRRVGGMGSARRCTAVSAKKTGQCIRAPRCDAVQITQRPLCTSAGVVWCGKDREDELPHSMTRTAWLGAMLLGGFFAVGAADAAEDATPFDVVVPLTGGGAFLGGQQKANIEQTEKMINRDGGLHGKPVHFVFHDDQSSPQVAVQLTTEILANHPPVVFGSTISALCNAMTPLMKDGPVHYCFSPSVRPAEGGFEFTSQVASRDQQHALVRYFRAKGWTRIALIVTTDASGQDADKSFNDIVKDPDYSDIKLVDEEHFNPSDVSIAAQIARISCGAAAGDHQLGDRRRGRHRVPRAGAGGTRPAGRSVGQQHDLRPDDRLCGLPAEAALFRRLGLGGAWQCRDRPAARDDRGAEEILRRDEGSGPPSRRQRRYRLGHPAPGRSPRSTRCRPAPARPSCTIISSTRRDIRASTARMISSRCRSAGSISAIRSWCAGTRGRRIGCR